MLIQKFIDLLNKKVLENYPEAVISIVESKGKINGKKGGISYKLHKDDTIASVIYPEDYMESYLSIGVESTVEEVFDALAGSDNSGIQKICDEWIELVESRQGILSTVRMCLVNAETNAELLKKVVHRSSTQFDGLEEVFYLSKDKFTVWLNADKVQELEIGYEELYLAASNNSTTAIYTMEDILDMLSGDKESECELKKSSLGMYVITNTEMFRGAAQAKDVCRLTDFLNEDVYLLPSSIHEFIAIPASVAKNESVLLNMVKEVNEREISPDEYLATAVYFYDRGQQVIRMVERG